MTLKASIKLTKRFIKSNANEETRYGEDPCLHLGSLAEPKDGDNDCQRYRSSPD